MEPKQMAASRIEQDGGRGRDLTRVLYGVENETDYLWCVLCERTYRRGRHRQVGDHRLCPFEPCEGGLLFEAWEWSQVRKVNPGYPRVPVEDVMYPFFGRGPEGADRS